MKRYVKALADCSPHFHSLHSCHSTKFVVSASAVTYFSCAHWRLSSACRLHYCKTVIAHGCPLHVAYRCLLYCYFRITVRARIKQEMWRIAYCNIVIYLTAVGLTPGGSSTVNIYTQTIHRTTQLTPLVRRFSGIRTQNGQTEINDELTA